MAAETIYFITAQTLQKSGFIHGNVNTEVIRSSIIRCQDRFIEPLLGSPLYEDLQSKVKAGTLNANETLLMDKYIRPLLTAHVEIRVARRITTQIRNAAASKATDPNFTTGTNDDLTNLRDDIHKDIEFYTRKLVGYLCENEEDFPLYDTVRNNKADVRRQFTAGSSIGVTRRNSRTYYRRRDGYPQPGDVILDGDD